MQEIYKKYSDNWFLNLYMKYGSVEEVFNKYSEYLPISSATFHRKIAKSSIIKSAGRQASLVEVLCFLEEKALAPNMPIERIYKMMPIRFQTSLVTIHRIYSALKTSLIRHEGVALVITQPDNIKNILVGFESKGNSKYGKIIGDLSLPMGFSKKGEETSDSILRILQQEVFTKLSIENKLSIEIRKNIKPFMFLDLADVRVKVFRIILPKNLTNLSNFSSYKLTNHHFLDINDLLKSKDYRQGVSEILNVYSQKFIKRFQHKSKNFNYQKAEIITSELNKALLLLKK